ncbi:uncharacterized protein V1513DRAFT_407261 [Lipomyces chichibuensis]|uniref:uncharacterized protein n=1 Tax=Lipomyces chichibuensis TaxID=1546026 RepID=UPI0033431286
MVFNKRFPILIILLAFLLNNVRAVDQKVDVTLCLVKACHMDDSQSECTGTYWYLSDLNALSYGYLFYDGSTMEKNTYYTIYAQSYEWGLQSTLIYFYDNNESQGKTIAFAKFRNSAYHFVAAQDLTGNSTAYMNDGILQPVLSACAAPYSAWSYTRVATSIVANGYAVYNS